MNETALRFSDAATKDCQKTKKTVDVRDLISTFCFNKFRF